MSIYGICFCCIFLYFVLIYTYSKYESTNSHSRTLTSSNIPDNEHNQIRDCRDFGKKVLHSVQFSYLPERRHYGK